MADRKLIPDMSTPEGIEKAFEHIREHSDSDPVDVTRAVNLEVLRILQEAGVEEADMLEERLKETIPGSGESRYKDIEELAADLTEEQKVTLNGDEHIDLKRVAGIASVVSGITSAAFAGAVGNGNQGAIMLKDAWEEFDQIGTSDEGEAAQRVLGGVMDDMVELLPVPEQ